MSLIATLTMVVSNATMTTPVSRITASLMNSGSSRSFWAPASGGAAALTRVPIHRHKMRYPHPMMVTVTARDKMRNAHLVVMVVG
jgi:hypothetical protein